ncbi:hypothetical protein COOONC_08558 [Cooperia oncophora]
MRLILLLLLPAVITARKYPMAPGYYPPDEMKTNSAGVDDYQFYYEKDPKTAEVLPVAKPGGPPRYPDPGNLPVPPAAPVMGNQIEVFSAGSPPEASESTYEETPTTRPTYTYQKNNLEDPKISYPSSPAGPPSSKGPSNGDLGMNNSGTSTTSNSSPPKAPTYNEGSRDNPSMPVIRSEGPGYDQDPSYWVSSSPYFADQDLGIQYLSTLNGLFMVVDEKPFGWLEEFPSDIGGPNSLWGEQPNYGRKTLIMTMEILMLKTIPKDLSMGQTTIEDLTIAAVKGGNRPKEVKILGAGNDLVDEENPSSNRNPSRPTNEEMLQNVGSRTSSRRPGPNYISSAEEFDPPTAGHRSNYLSPERIPGSSGQRGSFGLPGNSGQPSGAGGPSVTYSSSSPSSTFGLPQPGGNAVGNPASLFGLPQPGGYAVGNPITSLGLPHPGGYAVGNPISSIGPPQPGGYPVGNGCPCAAPPLQPCCAPVQPCCIPAPPCCPPPPPIPCCPRPPVCCQPVCCPTTIVVCCPTASSRTSSRRPGPNYISSAEEFDPPTAGHRSNYLSPERIPGSSGQRGSFGLPGNSGQPSGAGGPSVTYSSSSPSSTFGLPQPGGNAVGNPASLFGLPQPGGYAVGNPITSLGLPHPGGYAVGNPISSIGPPQPGGYPVGNGCPCAAPPLQPCCAPVQPCCIPAPPCCPPPPPIPCCPRPPVCCQPVCCPTTIVVCCPVITLPICLRACPACPCRRRMHRALRMKRSPGEL